MTTPHEQERVWRVVEAIPAINDLSAQYQNDIAEAILSERAELLATVERMRGALTEIVNLCPATCETTVAHSMADIARAALPTGEEK